MTVKNNKMDSFITAHPFLAFLKALWLLTLPLFLLLFFFNVSAHAQTFNEQEVLDKIYAYMEETYSLQKEDLSLNQIEDFADTKRTAFSFTLVNHPQNSTGIYSGSLNYNGTVSILMEPEEMTMDELFLKTSTDYGWTVEGFVAFKNHWQNQLDQVPNPYPSPQIYMYREIEDLKKLVQADVSLPKDGDLSFTEILAKTNEAIVTLPGFNQEVLALYKPGLSIYTFSPKFNQHVYRLVFDLYFDITLPEKEFHDFLAHQDKVFTQAFGSHLDAPRALLATIDPKTGAFLEDIFIYYSDMDYGDNNPLASTDFAFLIE